MKLQTAALFLLALLLVSCASQPTVRSEPDPVPAATPAPVLVPPRAVRACPECGRVEKMESVRVPVQRTPAKTGAVLGGVVGGVLTGPVKPSTGPAWQRLTQVSVRMDDGRRLVLRQNVISPNLHVGSRVRVSSGRVVLLR